ncbi:PREDICTED: peripheral-type benzodiazepine receptor-associated protein 1-like [Nipponia nippon]|uniref:peripheral-type benzodiazepine receptor-associated protein 1-like n=1 Tax=Nipponia nippon TaxID=128390 RepID=UPI000510F1E5|nr:PREDICTED: peripheral-type benzodiazepine receptor-associated protein 1-like [Nipponia nippon]
MAYESGTDYGFLVSQNTKLLSALEDLRHRCSSLAEENSLLRRSCFPQTEEKVKHLKRKNAELAVIAKRLEERARKLQEANLKVDDPRCLNVIEFDRLLRESQREVLRLQRQIALKNFKECLRSSKISSGGALPSTAARVGPPAPTLNTCIKGSPLPKETRLGDPALGGEARREEFELKKKRKKCENLEHEVRKKHKRCKELEIQLQEVQSENARLAEENLQLNEKAGWAGQLSVLRTPW